METPLDIAVPGGPHLEGQLGRPGGVAPSGGMVLCHPHPLYGGDMDNPVVVRLAEVAREHGLLTLRFNFRGVGASTGSHGAGLGEQVDVRAALEAIRDRLTPSQPAGLIGYSFGAWVAALAAAQETGVIALGLIAPPLRMLEFGSVATGRGPVLVAAGSRDPYCPLDVLRHWVTRLPGVESAVVEGADHFFSGALSPLAHAVRRWVARWGRDGSGSDAGKTVGRGGAG